MTKELILEPEGHFDQMISIGCHPMMVIQRALLRSGRKCHYFCTQGQLQKLNKPTNANSHVLVRVPKS